MIFNNIQDIRNDIYKRISIFLKNNNNTNIKYINSLLISYLTELKNLLEIDSYKSEIDIHSNNIITIKINKDSEFIFFKIDLDIEMRKIKINKLKSSNYFLKCINK